MDPAESSNTEQALVKKPYGKPEVKEFGGMQDLTQTTADGTPGEDYVEGLDYLDDPVS